MQHIIYHLSVHGRAGFVLSNGSMSSNTSGEGEIRQRIVDADLVDCMVALPPQLFYNTQIPACLWFLNRNKPTHRRGQTLFIDARNMGYLVSRVLRDLNDEDITHIAQTYHNWRTGEGEYLDVPGFCNSVTLDDIRGHGYFLTPGRYLGAAAQDEDDEHFAEKMVRLTAQLYQQMEESNNLNATIKAKLKEIGYGE